MSNESRTSAKHVHDDLIARNFCRVMPTVLEVLLIWEVVHPTIRSVGWYPFHQPRDARLFAEEMPRITLLGRDQLLPQLNEHLGARWPHRVDAIIAGVRRDQDTPETAVPS